MNPPPADRPRVRRLPIIAGPLGGLLLAASLLIGCQTPIEQRYLLYLPDDYSEAREWPLVFFLHGAGERGDDLDRVKVHGPPKLAEQGRSFPFVLVAPQVEKEGRWTVEFFDRVFDDVVSRYRIDRSRIYLTGLSMGGEGTWRVALAHPDRFAAIVPICGWSFPEDASTLKDVAIWVFHGAMDNVIPVSQSSVMVDALVRAGGRVRYTVYPDAEHDSWTVTYENPDLYEWMLGHRLAAVSATK